jgi:hypothetical protein
MKEDIRIMIKEYKKELYILETRRMAEKKAGRDENESYFLGQWCKLGSIICDLQALLRRHAKGDVMR